MIMDMWELWIYQWTHIPEWIYARQYFWVRLAINVGGKSFSKKKSKLKWTHNKAQHKQELLCGKIFGFGRNVYVVDEHFYSTLINLNIKVQQD
jgi:hypothetical protein